MSIYRSNLTPPDMPGFRLADPVLQNCGHDIPSDPDFDPNCGFATHDECAIIYAALDGPHMHHKTVVEVGSRFGWTAKAINAATNGCVLCIDPILKYGSPELFRFRGNLGDTFGSVITFPKTTEQFFRDRNIDGFADGRKQLYHAFMIDGNHEDIQPTNDCKGALSLAKEDCIIILHDGRGHPIVDAALYLLDHGFQARFYYTPNGMFICWRGFAGWAPPDHDRDPRIQWAGIEAELWSNIEKKRLS